MWKGFENIDSNFPSTSEVSSRWPLKPLSVFIRVHPWLRKLFSAAPLGIKPLPEGASQAMLLVNKPLTAQIFYHRFGAGMDVQFFINRSHVAAHGVDADVHPVGNFLVSITIGQLLEKFGLARREGGNG